MIETIRMNTFETNSSSCHSLTILTDEEYNNLINHKAFLMDDEYFVPTLDNFEDFVKENISWKESSIKNYSESIEKLNAIKNKGIKNCTEKELEENICWRPKSYTVEELSQRLEERLAYAKKELEECKVSLENRKVIDCKKVFDFIINHFSEISESISKNEWEFKELSEIENDIIMEYFEEVQTYDSYGYDEYETFDDSRKLASGETVHVIGYYGYDG